MRRLTIISFIFTLTTICFALPLPNTPPTFDIKKANTEFDHLNLKLSVQNLDIDDLQDAIETLINSSDQAEECITEVQKKINNIEVLITQSKNPTAGKKKEGADLIYLDNQHKALSDEQAQCRLFSIRAKEAINAYKSAIAKLKQQEALTRGLPLWTLIDQSIHSPIQTNWLQFLTHKFPSALLPSGLYWSISLILTLFISNLILRQLRKSIFAHRYLRFKKLKLYPIILLTTFFMLGLFFLYGLAISYLFTPVKYWVNLTCILFSFLSALVLIEFLTKINVIRACFYSYTIDIQFFRSIIITFLSFYTLILTSNLTSSVYEPENPLWSLIQSLLLIIILGITTYYIITYTQTHRHIPWIKKYYRLIRWLSFLTIGSCIGINFFGYYSLAKDLTFSGFTTFIILFSVVLFEQSANKLYLKLYQDEKIKLSIIRFFGYDPDQTFTEFLILKTILQIIIIAIGIFLVGQIWGFATDFIQIIYDQVLYGVHITTITIYPFRILLGTIVFCVLFLIFRAIANTLSGHQQFENEEETQVAVASLLTYIGFSLALISAFLIAGFDFTGLAIIAGALSVGIGLGLQSIVNNFVSGLILLIEKPIRPGDRISVGDVEGFVKKIRVRSTQIITPTREDIIIPNSDLITLRVTNYMLSDKYCRINCEVGVAYGSDTQLVQELLLNLAHQHEEVIKTGHNKPIVLLTALGDSNLIFQLWFLIKDVNKKGLVLSELYFAIEQTFRKYGINMAYPQLDVNIKYPPS